MLGDNQKYVYIIGQKPQGKAFGSFKPDTPENTLSRYAACPVSLGCGNSGIPNAPDVNKLYGALYYGPVTSQGNNKRQKPIVTDDFKDQRTYTTMDTSISVENSVGAGATFAALIDSGVGWSQCL